MAVVVPDYTEVEAEAQKPSDLPKVAEPVRAGLGQEALFFFPCPVSPGPMSQSWLWAPWILGFV